MTHRLLYVLLLLSILVLVQCDAAPPRQDCELRAFALSGRVLNADQEPVSGAVVRVFNEGSFEKPAFAFSTTSAGDGAFTTETVESHACTPFTVEVAADGYAAWSKRFYPLAWQASESAYEITVVLEGAAGTGE